MRSKNPVFNSNPAFGGQSRGGGSSPYGAGPYAAGYGTADLEALYNQPSATATQMGRMTLDDVIMRTATMFAVLLVGAAVGWLLPGLGFVGMFVGLVLGGLLAPVNWRLVFLISVPVGLFGTVWAYLKLQEVSTPNRRRYTAYTVCGWDRTPQQAYRNARWPRRSRRRRRSTHRSTLTRRWPGGRHAYRVHPVGWVARIARSPRSTPSLGARPWTACGMMNGWRAACR